MSKQSPGTSCQRLRHDRTSLLIEMASNVGKAESIWKSTTSSGKSSIVVVVSISSIAAGFLGAIKKRLAGKFHGGLCRLYNSWMKIDRACREKYYRYSGSWKRKINNNKLFIYFILFLFLFFLKKYSKIQICTSVLFVWSERNYFGY